MEKHRLLGKNKDMSTPARERRSGIQPNHAGHVTPDKPGGVISHLSHGLGDHVRGHTHPGNIARDGAAKRVTPVKVHGHMETRTKGGAVALGGNHKSALDAIRGDGRVPGADVSTLANEPKGKRLAPVAVKPGMRSRIMPHNPLLGDLIMNEALNGKPHWKA
jgi:hypothetical protein